MMDLDKNQLRTELALVLAKNKMTWGSLAEKSGFSKSFLSQWRSGRKAFRDSHYASICEVLDIEIHKKISKDGVSYEIVRLNKTEQEE